MESQLSEAILARKQEFAAQAETLSLKEVRRVLEGDLGMVRKALDAHKQLIGDLVDQIVLSNADEDSEHAAAAVKKQRPSTPPAQPKAKKPKASSSKPAPQKRKAAAAAAAGSGDGDEEEEEQGGSGGGGSGSEEEEEARPRKRGKVAGGGGGAGGGLKPSDDPKVKQLVGVCRAAGISVAPSVYVKNKDVPSLKAALSAMLQQHGLSASSDERSISRVRRQLEMAKDLEGIDCSNILDGEQEEGRGGRPSRRAAARVDYKSVLKPKAFEEIADSEEESSEEEEGDDAGSGSEDGGGSGLVGSDDEQRPAARSKQRAAGGGKRKQAAAPADSSGGDESEDDQEADAEEEQEAADEEESEFEDAEDASE